MIDAGKLRHRITFQQFDGQADSYGDPLDADDTHWLDVATTWASVDPISGRDFYAAEQKQSEVTHKVRLRYRSGITTAMRIFWKRRKMQIISVIDWEERHESLLLMCKELVP